MMSENSNKNKGHAFIEYTDPAHAKEAVKQLNGYQLRETKIKVQFNVCNLLFRCVFCGSHYDKIL